MSLAFGFAKNAERVAFGSLDQASRFELSLAKELFGRVPCVGPEMLGIVAGRASFCLRLGHGLRPPASRVGGGPLPHALGSDPGRLEYFRNLFAYRDEFAPQVTLGKLAQPSGQAISLGQEFPKLLSDPTKKLAHFGRIDPSKCLTEAPAGYFLRRQLVHELLQDTFRCG